MGIAEMKKGFVVPPVVQGKQLSKPSETLQNPIITKVPPSTTKSFYQSFFDSSMPSHPASCPANNMAFVSRQKPLLTLVALLQLGAAIRAFTVLGYVPL